MAQKKWTIDEVQAIGWYDFAKQHQDEFGFPSGMAMMGDGEIRGMVIATLRDRGLLIESAAATAGVPKPAAQTKPPKPAPVDISYPPYREQHEVAGKTVAEVMELLRAAWSIGERVNVWLNGQQITDTSVRLNAGDRLEFSRPAGEKGR